MLFIAPYFKGMENVDNVKDPLDCREIKDEEGNSMDDTFEISSEEDVSAVPKVENVFNTSQQVSVERTASSMLMESMFDKKEEPMSFSNHPIDMFFNALAAIVKAFPPHHQHKAKSQIFSVISDIEWQYLQESHGYPERENQSSNQISSSNIKNDSIDKTTLPCILKVTGSADIPNS